MARIPTLQDGPDDIVVKIPGVMVQDLDTWIGLQEGLMAGLELTRSESVRIILRATFEERRRHHVAVIATPRGGG